MRSPPAHVVRVRPLLSVWAPGAGDASVAFREWSPACPAAVAVYLVLANAPLVPAFRGAVAGFAGDAADRATLCLVAGSAVVATCAPSLDVWALSGATGVQHRANLPLINRGDAATTRIVPLMNRGDAAAATTTRIGRPERARERSTRPSVLGARREARREGPRPGPVRRLFDGIPRRLRDDVSPEPIDVAPRDLLLPVLQR